MFDDNSGRLVQTVADCERYLWAFMAENLRSTDRHIVAHSHDFDLYLPWLLEIVANQVGDRTDALPIVEVQRLYMEAAWNLVMQRALRPGPRTINGDPLKDGYGKGYSLTETGLKRLNEEAPAFLRTQTL
jgi:hypothetical protein